MNNKVSQITGFFKSKLGEQEYDDFNTKFESAISLCENVELIWPRFANWIISDEKFGMCCIHRSDGMRKVCELLEKVISGEIVTKDEWLIAKNICMSEKNFISSSGKRFPGMTAHKKVWAIESAINITLDNPLGTAYAAYVARSYKCNTNFCVTMSMSLIDLIRGSK